MVISLSGKLSLTRKKFEELIHKHGGSVTSSITKRTTHLITTDADFNDESAKVLKAREMNLPILREEFIHDLIRTEGNRELMKSMESYDLNFPATTVNESQQPTTQEQLQQPMPSETPATNDQNQIKPTTEEDSLLNKRDRSPDIIAETSNLEPEPKRLKTSELTTVMIDPEYTGNKEDKVYYDEVNKVFYSIDLTKDGSFYRLQMTTSTRTDGVKYGLFEKSGAEVTNQPAVASEIVSQTGTRVQVSSQCNYMEFDSLEDAKKEFENRFLEKTQNTWQDFFEKKFTKKDGMYNLSNPEDVLTLETEVLQKEKEIASNMIAQEQQQQREMLQLSSVS